MDLFSQQPEIILPAHNCNGNDSQFQENREHFKSQTEVVLEHLELGEWVTGIRMYELHKIQDIRPRIAAIKKLLALTGRVLLEEKIKGAHGAKRWALEDSIKIPSDKFLFG